MKKNLLFLMATAAIATGCSEDSVLESGLTSESNQIAFGTYKTITKGTPIANNEAFMSSGNSFGVVAFVGANSDAYMGSTSNGVQIKFDGTIWDYAAGETPALWPGTQLLKFYGYTPFVNSSMSNLAFANAGMTFDYAVSTDLTEQTDLMVATTNASKSPNKVNMPFKHALTQVKFEATTSVSNLRVEIAANGITLNKIKSTGTLALIGADATNAPTWTDLSDPISYNFISNSVKGDLTAGAGKVTNTDGHVLMLLPQTFVGTDVDAENGSSLTITYRLLSLNGDAETPVVDDNTDSNGYITQTIAISSNVEGTEVWGNSKIVTYTLNFGSSDFIMFDTSVTDWTDAAKNPTVGIE